MFTCKKQLSIGNRIIDSAHMELFGVIDRLATAINARDIAAISEAFDLLENCLNIYFSVEESVARAANFDFTRHRLDHQALSNEFRRMRDWLLAKNGAWSEFEKTGCIDSLRCYLVRHIKEDGRPLKVVLETHFYDFKP